MNDMENKDRNDVPENQGDSFHPSAAESTEPSASSADSTAAGEQKYQYQPPVADITIPGSTIRIPMAGILLGSSRPPTSGISPNMANRKNPMHPKARKKA